MTGGWEGKYDGEYPFTVQTADKAFSGGEAFGSTVKNIVAGTDYYFASLIIAEDAKGNAEAFIGNVGDFEAGSATKIYNEMGRTWGGELGKGDVTWQSVPEHPI